MTPSLSSPSFAPFPPSVVIGCGAWGENLVRTLKNMNALKAIIDHNAEHASFISQKYDVPIFSLQEALLETTVQAIFIATRSESHFELAHQALSHKKNVFVEKPLSRTTTEAQELFVVATRYQKILMPGHLLLHHPCYQQLQKEVQQGRIGDTVCITTRRQNFGKFFENENILWDLGPHDLSIILGLLPSESPKKISFLQGKFLVKDDIFSGMMAFENGPKASLFLSRLSPMKEQNLTVIGTKGILVFEDTLPWDKKLQLVPFKEEGSWPPLKKDPIYIEVPQEEPLKQECLAFFKAIQTGILPQSAQSVVELVNILEKFNNATTC